MNSPAASAVSGHTDKQALMARIIELHRSYFHIEYNQDPALPFYAGAVFHSDSAAYAKEHKQRLSGRETHEYVYFVFAPEPEPEAWQVLAETAFSDGFSHVRADRKHLVTDVTLIVLADRLPDATRAVIRQTRRSKSLCLGLLGYVNLRCYAVDCAAGQSFCNRSGRKVKENLDLMALYQLKEAEAKRD